MKIKNTLAPCLVYIALLWPSVICGQKYTVSSLLGEGRWVKIAVTEPGIYRIDYSQIIAMGFSDPAQVALFGNNTGQLSFYNDGSAPDDLRKIGIHIEKGADNVFNDGDYLLFYGEGTHRWKYDGEDDKYRFSRHYYSDTAYYFVTAFPGGASYIIGEAPPAGTPDRFSVSADAHFRHEVEGMNLIRSGREWYEQVVAGKVNNLSPLFSNIITTEKIHFTIRCLARSDTESSFTFRQGTSTVTTLPVQPLNMTDLNGIFANVSLSKDSCYPASSSPEFSLTFNSNGNIAATGYIDYVDLYGRARLVYSDKQLFISDSRTAGEDILTQFSISSQGIVKVWDISDPFSPKVIETSYSGGNTVFRAATDSLRSFVAFNVAHALRPRIDGTVVMNQDLHALGPVDMVIVTHPLFRKYADKLSQLHMEEDGLLSVVLTPQQIYNEFSGGIPDAAAIRNFLKMMYDRGNESSTPMKYVLLFGDGSYENKTRPPKNPAYIPTWQSVNSNIGVLSFTSDDFYGLLDDGEGEADGYLDIGIGRMPVADTTEAGIVIRKISSYIKNHDSGSWRNILCMVADDEDDNLHMTDAESLVSAVNEAAPPMVTEKIYLDAYRQVSSVSGDSYPDAVRALNDRIAAGCLIVNYVGHGSETGLAHERVVRTDNINSWKNMNMLPLFITATCEFSRFDDAEINQTTGAITRRTSAGEMVLLNPEGGGIGLMSTTRVVYSAPNYTLNRKIYDYAFEADAAGRSMRMGDIIKLAKVNSGPGMNKRNFLLLGDPALRLAWPVAGRVLTDSINGVEVTSPTDSLKALSMVTISGHIEDRNGILMDGFNGTLEPKIFDKTTTITTLGNDGGQTMAFPVTGNILFNGSTEVSDGLFRFSFVVPLDINYSFGKGRISYYCSDDNSDMNGNYSGIVVGGFSDINYSDNKGPEIRLYMNDTLFAGGGITDTNPTLLALISDESGINATGAGIGHDIIAWIDDNQSEAVILNSLFRTDIGEYHAGSLSYPLEITGKGEHTITLRAWDNLNNPSVATLRFNVETGGTFRLTDLKCHPNPAYDHAVFSAGHNRPETELNIVIRIINASGNVVRVIRESSNTAGYRLEDITWDGCDNGGGRVSPGLYFWHIEATTADGEKASKTGKIIIL